MTLPFNKLEHHKVYKNTFLQCVYVILEYSCKSDNFFDDAFYDRLERYITEQFPGMDFDANKARHSKGNLGLENKKEGLRFELHNGRIIVIVDKRRYRSFVDSVIPLIYRLVVYLKEVIKVDSLNKVIEKKINLWLADQNKPEEKEFNFNYLEDLILSDNIKSDKGNRVDRNADEHGQQLVWKNEWTKDEVGGKINLMVSRVHIANNSKRGCLVLDSDVCDMNVSTDNLPKTLMDANGILYDVYHWAVSERVIKMMEKEYKSINDTNGQTIDDGK